MALVLVWRRLDLGLTTPLSWKAMGVCAVGVSMLAILSLLPGESIWRQRFVVIRYRLIETSLLLCTASLCAPGIGWLKGLALFAFTVAVVAGLPHWAQWLRFPKSNLFIAAPAIRLAATGDAEDCPDSLIHAITRTKCSDGQEQISAQLRVPFAAGEKRATVHVPFCPPLEPLPECSADVVNLLGLDGIADVEVAQVIPAGARIEVHLSPAAKTAGAVHVSFVALPPSSPAE
jgi:hypothetical protein